MANSKKENEKKDWYFKVMIAQTVVCAVLVAVLFISASSQGKLASLLRSEYLMLMSDDITVDDIEDALKYLKENNPINVHKTEGESSVDTFNSNEPAQEESETVQIGGGEDLQFTSLDALEGICFDEYVPPFLFEIPLENYEITSRFGYRVSPINGNPGLHTGIDLATDYGEAIYATADGVVLDASYDNSYGYYVKLQHDDNYVTIYAHCSSLCVDEGDTVMQGDVIAKVGSTGASTGNHLHFEIRKDNIRIDPEYALIDL